MSKRGEPLTEDEARRLGAWLERELGQGPGPEVLAAQRLRLAQTANGSERRMTRLWAVGGGMLTAAVAVGAVVLVGKWRAGQTFVLAPRHPGISAEPLSAATGERGDRDGARLVADTQFRTAWTWRRASSGEREAVPLNESNAVILGQWLDATSESVALELSSAERPSRGRLHLASGSRAQVVEVDATTLKMKLEDGLAKVIVDEQPSGLSFQAGPYAVRAAEAGLAVDYEVSWSAKAGALRVQVTSGEVEVAATDNTRHVVRPGNPLNLTASEQAPSNTSTATRRLRTPAVQQVDDPVVVVESLPSETPGVVRGAHTSTIEPTSSVPVTSNLEVGRWRKFAENGQYTAAVKEAELVGFGTLEQNASASDLLLLADVARLGGAPQKARGVLLSLRNRYPGHTNSATAAFTLGRMAQEQEHDDRRAMQWYRTYLKEEPRGRMAEGARARLLKAALRVGSRAEKEQAAKDYLAQHPTGSSAAVARSMLSK